MSEILGRQLEVGVAVEATRGTAETSPDRWMRNVLANFIHRAQRASDNATRGRLEDSEASRVVQEWYEGNLEGIVHIDMLGYFLYNLYGAVDSAVVSGSVYDHEFTLDQVVTHPALTLFAKDGGVAQHRFAGGVVNTLEISATVDEYLRMTANMLAKNVAADTNTPAYLTEYDFIGRDITIKTADTEGDLGAATAVKAKNVTIRFDSGAAALRNHVFGSRKPDNIFNGRFAVEVEVTRDFIDTTYRDLFVGDDSKYAQIVIQGEADISGSGHYPTITLLLNKAQVTAWDRNGANDDLVSETFTLKGFYNATDEQQSAITLRNLTTAYAVGS